MVLQMVSIAFFLMMHANSSPSSPLQATVTIGKEVVAVTADRFVGATLDWWRGDDPTYALFHTGALLSREGCVSAVLPSFCTAAPSTSPAVASPKFKEAGALTVDLTNPSLLAAAAGLRGGLLRIGGTPEDGIIYEVEGGECARVPANPTCNPNSGYSCCKCGDVYGCLTMRRWTELLLFANSTDLKLVFGLNGCRGRTSSPSTPMDISNIRNFLNWTVRHGFGDSIYGLELGNELTKGYVEPKTLANDFLALQSIVDTLWPTPANRPVIVGPDEIVGLGPFLQALKGRVLGGVTFHQYGPCGHDPLPPGHGHVPPLTNSSALVIDPVRCLDGPEQMIGQAVTLVEQYAPRARAWVGESALTGGGGRDNVTNAFVSTLWYSDWLGISAKGKVAVVLRETLIGGYYGLVDAASFALSPDAYLLSLFAKLMGDQVHDVKIVLPNASTPEQRTMLRAYAQTTRGGNPGLTLMLINLGTETTFTVAPPFAFDARHGTAAEVEAAAGVGATRDEYHLTAVTAPSGKEMALNGVELKLVGGGTMMPPMKPKVIDGAAPILVAPASVVFVAFRAAA